MHIRFVNPAFPGSRTQKHVCFHLVKTGLLLQTVALSKTSSLSRRCEKLFLDLNTLLVLKNQHGHYCTVVYTLDLDKDRPCEKT
eukprot:snap_masked-scaffold_9-processed-gene-5.38-mRNA-1 protein AED:1.00 eAED:1.00 QI:0/0/0/0/1/1/2/0/83